MIRFSTLRVLIAAFAIAFVPAVSAPAGAQQPTSVNPTASSVQEQQLLNTLRSGDVIAGRGTIPDPRAHTLIQPGGREWTYTHQVTMHWIGAIAILGMIAVLVAWRLAKGAVKLDHGYSGVKITRFTGFERFIHWFTAVSFIVLALSGLNITFGKTLLLPLVGPEAFAWLSQWGKYAHNYLSFPFMLGLLVLIGMWALHNLPNKADLQWIKEGGGLIPGKHPAAGKFNAGQKIIYWTVVLSGIALSITGVFLLFPFNFAATVSGMQLVQIIHGIVGMILVGVMVAHIYIGTPVGMEGAFPAMGSGEVDLNWAKQHHSLWVEEEMRGRGKPTARPQMPPSAIPAE